MSKDGVDRAAVYKFLQRLVAKHPDGAVELLQDIIVNNCIFPDGDGTQFAAMSEMDQQIAELMANDQKINAVKVARDTLRIGLKEAKDYVESKNWPAQKITGHVWEKQQLAAKAWMDKVSKDYGV